MENNIKTKKDSYAISEQDEIDLLLGKEILFFKFHYDYMESVMPGSRNRNPLTIGDMRLFLRYKRWFPRWFVEIYYNYDGIRTFYLMLLFLLLIVIYFTLNINKIHCI